MSEKRCTEILGSWEGYRVGKVEWILVVSGDPRLSQKATTQHRVGWGLVSPRLIGGHKARRYAKLANGHFVRFRDGVS